MTDPDELERQSSRGSAAAPRRPGGGGSGSAKTISRPAISRPKKTADAEEEEVEARRPAARASRPAREEAARDASAQRDDGAPAARRARRPRAGADAVAADGQSMNAPRASTVSDAAERGRRSARRRCSGRWPDRSGSRRAGADRRRADAARRPPRRGRAADRAARTRRRRSSARRVPRGVSTMMPLACAYSLALRVVAIAEADRVGEARDRRRVAGQEVPALLGAAAADTARGRSPSSRAASAGGLGRVEAHA